MKWWNVRYLIFSIIFAKIYFRTIKNYSFFKISAFSSVIPFVKLSYKVLVTDTSDSIGKMKLQIDYIHELILFLLNLILPEPYKVTVKLMNYQDKLTSVALGVFLMWKSHRRNRWFLTPLSLKKFHTYSAKLQKSIFFLVHFSILFFIKQFLSSQEYALLTFYRFFFSCIWDLSIYIYISLCM